MSKMKESERKDNEEKDNPSTEIVPMKKESKFIALWRAHKTKIVAGLIFMFIFLAIVIVLIVKKVKKKTCVSGEYGDICTMYENNLQDYSATVES